MPDKRIVELRSDTFTHPTKSMLEAMISAPVGDDVFGEDYSVNLLEQKAADLFGMESALFCASGTMTNQLAIRVHCTPGSEVICDALSHVYIYEGGGIAVNAFSSVKPIHGDRGRLTANQVIAAINNPNDVHQPVSKLVSIENTANRGGGSIYDFEEIKKIKEICLQNNLMLHLDGARLFNALVETKETPLDYSNVFDSISICLSKGLGCPIGSILLGKNKFITQARRYRKLMGGGWRQAGYLAAGGIYALDNHIERLKDDHLRAKHIGEILSKLSYVDSLHPIESNIIICHINAEKGAKKLAQKLAEINIRAIAINDSQIRFVTHLDFTDEDLEYFEKGINRIKL